MARSNGNKRVKSTGGSKSKGTYKTQKPTQLRNTVKSRKPKGGAKGAGRGR